MRTLTLVLALAVVLVLPFVTKNDAGPIPVCNPTHNPHCTM